jgi:hypothetical protein
VGDHLAAWTFLGLARWERSQQSMTSYERRPNYVALKPPWKGNLAWLFLVAMTVSASIFVFAAK